MWQIFKALYASQMDLLCQTLDLQVLEQLYTINSIDSEPIILSSGTSTNSNSYIGELDAVDMTLDYLLGCQHIHHRIVILSDCQSAIIAILAKDPHTRCRNIRNIQRKATALTNRGSKIEITWVAGHTGLKANNLADEAAKLGAKEAADWVDDTPNIPSSAMKAKIHLNIIMEWQKKWDADSSATITHQLMPYVSDKTPPSPSRRNVDRAFNRLVAGRTRLREHLHNIGWTGIDTPTCECKEENESIAHYLL